MNVECIVIGAGIIGLACARKLAMSGIEVVIVEAMEAIGTETSSRNSEVIHAGIYYPKDSLKAKFCVAGKKQLYEYCESHAIPFKRLGKLIVASSVDEIPGLKALEQKAIHNNVLDLQFLSPSEIQALEPEIDAVAALFSPSTGIIDSHAFMLALLGDAEEAGAMLAVKSRVVGGKIEEEGIALQVQGENGDIETITAKIVINSAGLHAIHVASSIIGISSHLIPKPFYCKGSYFSLGAPSPFKHLVYPIPNAAGLGVHATLDLAGQARFGPDTEWVDTPNYEVDPKRADSFYEAIRRYWPNLKDGTIHPGYVGMRPKVVGPQDPAADFMIQTYREHGIPGLVNLYGIESPGLTASLPIADRIFDILSSEANNT